MRKAFRSIWQYPAVKVLVSLLVVAASLYALYYTRGIWFLFITALIVAYLSQPLMNWCERTLKARWLGVLFFVLGLFLLLGLTSVLIAGLIDQVSRFAGELPDLINSVIGTTESIPANIRQLALPAVLIDAISQAYEILGSLLENLTNQTLQALESFVTNGGLMGKISAVIGDVVRFLAFLAITMYLLIDLPKIGRSLREAWPKPYQDTMSDIAHKFEHSVGGYFRGQLIIALAVGVMVGIGLAIIKVPLALSLGFLAGVFNLVPYLGVVIAITPSLLLAVSLGGWQVLGVLLVFIVANQLEAHVLSPLIMSRTTQLHPITIILAILLGARLMGVWGAVIAVPIAGFLKLIYEDYYLPSRFHSEG